MSKLPKEHKFIDFSDYGRPVAVLIARSLKNSTWTAVHVTLTFIVSGLFAIFCIIYEYYLAAAFFLILKSILDAADGELARLKNSPSYVGRYFDSVSDIILNLLIFITLWQVTESKFIYMLLAFIGIQLQGTLYNYYYVILRNRCDGDTTSRVFEDDVPKALKGEKQSHVNVLFSLYKLLYGLFDKTIIFLDPKAQEGRIFPKWFMTFVSLYGLGFQLFIIAAMLVMGWKSLIIPFFIWYSILIAIFVAIRRIFLSKP